MSMIFTTILILSCSPKLTTLYDHLHCIIYAEFVFVNATQIFNLQLGGIHGVFISSNTSVTPVNHISSLLIFDQFRSQLPSVLLQMQIQIILGGLNHLQGSEDHLHPCAEVRK